MPSSKKNGYSAPVEQPFSFSPASFPIPRTRASVGKFERHNERKNESYANLNVDCSQSHRNVHFKTTGGLPYNEYLDKLIAEGKVSLRGLKKDAKVFDELVLDVNSAYFEQHGGYDYAVRFYEAAFRFAQELYGEENIIAAVMHADELNKGISTGHPVYHYHLHVMALPVVEKQVLWTKRCKGPALVGTVKEIVHQVSHSKKWASDTPMLDEAGQPVLQKNGKPKFVASYSILQDRFLDYMRQQGFTDIQQGEKGSTTEHLSTLDYQIAKDTKRLEALKKQVRAEQAEVKAAKKVHKTVQELQDMGKPTILGKMQVTREDYDALTLLAGEGIRSQREIRELRQGNKELREQLQQQGKLILNLQKQLLDLERKCRPFLDALEHFPELVKTFMAEVKRLFAEREPARKATNRQLHSGKER